MKHWITAARLRTLPLALSCIVTGSACAYILGGFRWSIFINACITTILLQVLSNFSNDYGDGVKGTDENRIGPARAIQSGWISHEQMKKGIVATIILTLISGISLLLISGLNIIWTLIFFSFGILSILAAYKYTVGKNAYGYRALGDLFVFLFFGLMGVLGSSYLYVHTVSLAFLLPAISIGALSTAVLHLNNMRDTENDIASNKRTVANIIGIQKSKYYFVFLLITAMVSLLAYNYMRNTASLYSYAFVLIYPLFFMLIKKVMSTKEYAQYDAYLKPLALGTFGLSILFAIGILWV